MLSFMFLDSSARSVEGQFEFLGFDPKNANPMDMITSKRPVGCAARAFILAVALDQITDNEHRIMFTYHRAHKQISKDRKLSEFEGNSKAPRMDICHARVEIVGDDLEPYIVDPIYTKDFTVPHIQVTNNPDLAGSIGPSFDDPVEGLKDYCTGHDRLTQFDLADIDRAREILVNHNFSAQLKHAA